MADRGCRRWDTNLVRWDTDNRHIPLHGLPLPQHPPEYSHQPWYNLLSYLQLLHSNTKRQCNSTTLDLPLQLLLLTSYT